MDNARNISIKVIPPALICNSTAVEAVLNCHFATMIQLSGEKSSVRLEWVTKSREVRMLESGKALFIKPKPMRPSFLSSLTSNGKKQNTFLFSVATNADVGKWFMRPCRHAGYHGLKSLSVPDKEKSGFKNRIGVEVISGFLTDS